MQNYDLVIANDHAGFDLKLKILDFLKKKNYKGKIIDVGTDSRDSVDYPDYSQKAVQEIIDGNAKYGILICGTGIGMSIAANRNSSIRAAICCNEIMAEKARAHNNANILVLGSRLTEERLAFKMIEIFLNTEFEGGRHASRLSKIS